MKLVVWLNSTSQLFEYVGQINSAGLVKDQDYTWSYVPVTNPFLGNHSPTWLGQEEDVPQHVEFEFEDEKWATYFQLRWT